jgi:hypothetical protein
MADTDKVEQVEKPAPEPKDLITDLDADASAEAPAAEDTEQVDPEDTEPKAEDPVKDAESAEDSDEESEPERKKRSGTARLKARLAAAYAELETFKRIAPKQDDATALNSLVETEIGPAPKEADFNDYLAYQNASIAYDTERRIVTRELRQKAAHAQELQKAANEELVDDFKGRADKAREILKDFDQVMQAATVSPSHPEIIHLILSSDKGPEIAYYLCMNPKVVHSLNEMSPFAAAREIGKLEQSASLATPKTVTKAPAPVEPIKGGTAPPSKFDPEKASFEEYKAKRASGWKG